MAPMLPQGWECAMAPRLPPRLGMGYGSTAFPKGVGNGSTASPRWGWAMAPLLPQGRGWAEAIGLVSPPPYVFWAGVWKGPPYVFLGGPLPKKRVALRASPA